MTFKRILYSGFDFTQDDELQQYKFKMINSILLIVTFFSALFGVLSDFGINDIGAIYTKINYIYSLSAFSLIFFLRRSKDNFPAATNILILTSLLTFTSALILVTQDEFRMIWFFLLVFITYILGGEIKGLVVTVASISIILISHYFVDLKLSQIAINSGVVGIIIGSLFSRFHTNKVGDYERHLKEKNEVLHTYASTDPLTGITNRRVFNEICERYFETAQRDDKILTLLMLDLDHFKDINDTYGHQTGDLILIKFASVIQSLLRKSDTFARIGGEEFAILLYGTDSNGAFSLAEKIRSQVNKISLRCENADVSVTTSIGISHNKHTDKSFSDIFGRADNALYQAKDLGRDQTSILV